jgi:hypothetical protein
MEDWAAVDNYIDILRERGLSEAEAMKWLGRIPASYYQAISKDNRKAAEDRYYAMKNKQADRI